MNPGNQRSGQDGDDRWNGVSMLLVREPSFTRRLTRIQAWTARTAATIITTAPPIKNP